MINFRYTPNFEGLDKFKGLIYHSADWPEEPVDLSGKRVAVIGTGATGVQIIQEIGPIVSHLTVYQRTPNLALPMRQVNREQNTADENGTSWRFPDKNQHDGIFNRVYKTFTAAVLDKDFTTKVFHETEPEERRELYEQNWAYGGFASWVGGFFDIFFNQEANDEIYNFWAEKTRARIQDKRKRDILAPRMAPHNFGTKRPCLESSYYEVFNQDNVDIINIRQSPIIEITENGISNWYFYLCWKLEPNLVLNYTYVHRCSHSKRRNSSSGYNNTCNWV